MLIEMFEDYDKRRSEIKDAIKAGGGNTDRLVDALDSIERVLGYTKAGAAPMVTGDELVDEWERELSEGRVPESLKQNIVKPRRRNNGRR